MARPIVLALLALLSASLIAHSTVGVDVSGDGDGGPSALSPFDPREWDVHMPSAERAYRAAHTPGGEASYCCCYCGRGAQQPSHADDGADEATSSDGGVDEHRAAARAAEAAGVPAADSWLYAPLPRQPRPERGDPTDRLRRLQRSRKGRRKRRSKRRRHKRGESTAKAKVKGAGQARASPPLDPSDLDAEEEQRVQLSSLGGVGDVGVANFYVYRTVLSVCDNEYCRTRSEVCMRSQLWTGWAGAMTTANGRAPLAVVQQRCANVYQREMEVLADFNRILERESEDARRMLP